jgi:hypothetical protein
MEGNTCVLEGNSTALKQEIRFQHENRWELLNNNKSVCADLQESLYTLGLSVS